MESCWCSGVPAVDIIPAVWSAECGPYCVIARHPDGPGGTTMRGGTREPPTSTIIGTGYQHDDDAWWNTRTAYQYNNWDRVST